MKFRGPLSFNFNRGEHAAIRRPVEERRTEERKREREKEREREKKKGGGGERKSRSLREDSFAPHERLEIPSSNNAPSPPRCVTGVRMAPLETVSTGAHPLVENTYRRENKLPSYKRRGTSPRKRAASCFLSAGCTTPNGYRDFSFSDIVYFHRGVISLLTFQLDR